MKTTNNELEKYINQSLHEKFDKIAVLKVSPKSSIYVFKNKKTGQKIIERISKNRNDEVFRTTRNKGIKNLTEIYEVCSTEDYLITIEEFIEGENLSNIISEKRLSKKLACKYACQICNALIGLHERGIVHRDIKPENIIISNDSNAYLIDLSIARMINSSNKKDTQSLGTVGYAAPEQYGIIQSNSSTDLYALGIVLNQMITGMHPSIETTRSVPLKRIIKKATSMQISRRYKNAKQVRIRLKILSKLYI